MGRPKKTEVDSKIENPETKKPRKASTKSKEFMDASGFRTTIPPGDAYKLKMTTSEGEKIIISENLSQIVDAIKKLKQDFKKVKIDFSKVIKT
jgi:ribosomal protein L9